MQHGGNDSLVKEYMAAVYNCDWNFDLETDRRKCASLSAAELSQGLQINPEVQYYIIRNIFLICVSQIELVNGHLSVNKDAMLLQKSSKIRDSSKKF